MPLLPPAIRAYGEVAVAGADGRFVVCALLFVPLRRVIVNRSIFISLFN